MTRKHAGFTDLRILGGSRQRGGGVDADPRIKLPPVMSLCVALCHRRHRTHVLGSSLCVWLCALAAIAHTCSAHLSVCGCMPSLPSHTCSAHLYACGCTPSPPSHTCAAHLFACGCVPSLPSHARARLISMRVAVCHRCHRTHVLGSSLRVWLCALAAVAHTCAAHIYACGFVPSLPSHTRARLISMRVAVPPRRRRTHVLGSSLCVWLCALAAVAHTCSARLCACGYVPSPPSHPRARLYACGCVPSPPSHTRAWLIHLCVAICPRRHRARMGAGPHSLLGCLASLPLYACARLS
jgi:hypothetical protein